MIAADHAASEFTLPTLEFRSLVKRALVPVLIGAAVLVTVILGGHRLHAITAVLHRALGVNAAWTAAGIVFECVSVAGYVVLLALVAGRVTPRVRPARAPRSRWPGRRQRGCCRRPGQVGRC